MTDTKAAWLRRALRAEKQVELLDRMLATVQQADRHLLYEKALPPGTMGGTVVRKKNETEPEVNASLRNEDRTRCEVWTRVMGYHRPVSMWNRGKQAEHRDRVPFREQPRMRRP